MNITPTALASLCQQHLLAMFSQIGNDFAIVLINDQSTNRHAHENVIRALAIAIRTATVLAIFCLVQLGIAIID